MQVNALVHMRTTASNRRTVQQTQEVDIGYTTKNNNRVTTHPKLAAHTMNWPVSQICRDKRLDCTQSQHIIHLQPLRTSANELSLHASPPVSVQPRPHSMWWPATTAKRMKLRTALHATIANAPCCRLPADLLPQLAVNNCMSICMAVY